MNIIVVLVIVVFTNGGAFSRVMEVDDTASVCEANGAAAEKDMLGKVFGKDADGEDIKIFDVQHKCITVTKAYHA